MNEETARLIKHRHSWVAMERNSLIANTPDFDQEAERDFFSNSIRLISHSQHDANDAILHTMNNELKPKTFFLQGPAGMSKTFLYKTLCNEFRPERKIILCVASFGIASLLLLLPNGKKAHSLFKNFLWDVLKSSYLVLLCIVS